MAVFTKSDTFYSNICSHSYIVLTLGGTEEDVIAIKICCVRSFDVSLYYQILTGQGSKWRGMQ